MLSRGWPITTAGLVLTAVVSASVASLAEDSVSGLITRTYVIVEDTELSGDVTCDVTGAPCFSFGASGVALRLNGFSITGKADPVTGCGGTVTAQEVGITTGGRNNVSIQGPGLVQRFRNTGVLVSASTGTRIEGITASTNCASGILVQATSFDTFIEDNVAVRNGSSAAGLSCGGI
jgi:hypothetical protein